MVCVVGCWDFLPWITLQIQHQQKQQHVMMMKKKPTTIHMTIIPNLPKPSRHFSVGYVTLLMMQMNVSFDNAIIVDVSSPWARIRCIRKAVRIDDEMKKDLLRMEIINLMEIYQSFNSHTLNPSLNWHCWASNENWKWTYRFFRRFSELIETLPFWYENLCTFHFAFHLRLVTCSWHSHIIKVFLY